MSGMQAGDLGVEKPELTMLGRFQGEEEALLVVMDWDAVTPAPQRVLDHIGEVAAVDDYQFLASFRGRIEVVETPATLIEFWERAGGDTFSEVALDDVPDGRLLTFVGRRRDSGDLELTLRRMPVTGEAASPLYIKRYAMSHMLHADRFGVYELLFVCEGDHTAPVATFDDVYLYALKQQGMDRPAVA